MFKILVIAMFAQYGYGISMTSQVIEFDTKQKAEDAYERLPRQDQKTHHALMQVVAHKLYKGEN